MKFRKMSVPFAPQPGISGIFGRMESAFVVCFVSLVVVEDPTDTKWTRLRATRFARCMGHLADTDFYLSYRCSWCLLDLITSY